MGRIFQSCLLILAGCRPFIPSPPELLPSPQVLLQRARQPSIVSMKALVRIKLSSPENSGVLTHIIVAREPSSLRLETLGPWGNTIFVLCIKGENLIAYSTTENIYYMGTSSQQNISRFLPLDLPREALVSLALGKPILLPANEDSMKIGEEKRGYSVSFTLSDRPGQQKLLFSRDNFNPLSSTALGEGGSTIFSVTFSDYSDIQQIPFPHRITFVIPNEKITVGIVFKDISLNTDIQDDAFSFPMPSGARAASLDEQ